MASFLAVIRSIALLLARVALGGILILHGVARWNTQGGPTAGIQRTVDYLNQFAVPYVQVASWSVISIEIVGGILLVAGAFTPVVALLIIAEQAFLIAYTNWYKGAALLNDNMTYNGGWEYNVAIAALALLFLVFGSGRVAVDSLFRRKKSTDTEDDYATSTGTASYSNSRVGATV